MSVTENDTTTSTQNGYPTTPAKPGFTTSEFWQTLLTNLLAVIVAIASLFNTDIDTPTVAALTPAIAVLAAAIASGLYARARSTVKSATAQAAAISQTTNAGLQR